ncbi:MAG: tetratricopeptide repeat protein [Elusimicrobia bacterium]|nr:tetratricopeptide repeat protein [Elusimicrobiota bacterium]
MKRMVMNMVVVSVALCFAGKVLAQDALTDAFYASYTAESQKNVSGAITALKAVEPAERDSYVLNLRLGWLSYLAGLWNESIAYYQRAADLAPEAIEPLQGVILPLAAAGKTTEIAKTHQDIIKLDPNNYRSLSQLAWRSYLSKDYKKAAGHYARLVKLHPTDTEMLLGLGYSQKLGGALDEAKKQFQRVLLLSPRNPRALEGLK